MELRGSLGKESGYKTQVVDYYYFLGIFCLAQETFLYGGVQD